MTWLHRQLLRLLPRGHRDRYGNDIVRVFVEQRRSSRRRERPALWAREVRAILVIAARSRRPRVGLPIVPRGDQRWSGWTQDLVHASRNVLRAPGHAAAVVLCLGVGIAITLAAFAVVNAAFYGDLPGVVNRDSLSRVYVRQALGGGTVHVSRFRPEHFDIFREHGPAIASVGGQSDSVFPVRVDGEMFSVDGAFVSGDYFRTLGTRPVLGRLLEAADEQRATAAVVIGERFWRRHFGGSPAALGQVLTVAGRDLQIVGVVPAGLIGIDLMGLGEDFEERHVWLPLSLARGWPGSSKLLVSIAVRHAPGADRDAVASELSVQVARLPWRQVSPNPRPLAKGPDDSGADIATAFLLVLAVPLALLAIGCANVANLQLARSLDRTRELAVRLSLGASRARVMRLLAIEAAMLTCGAVAVSWLGARALLAWLFTLVPFPIYLDWRVFGAAAGLALVVVAMCGIAPGWLVASRLELGALKQTPQSGARPHARLRHALVGLQVAISLTLLILSGLMARTLGSVLAGVPELSREVLSATVNVEQSGLDERATARLAAGLADALARDGRVLAVGVSTADRQEWRYLHPGDGPDARQFARVSRVTPGYFPAKGMSAVAGRTLMPGDLGTPAVVISQTLARAIERDGTPALGRRLRLEPTYWPSGEPKPAGWPIEIVGVVPDAYRHPLLHVDTLDIYVPLGDTLPTTFTLSARSATPGALVPTLRRALDTLEPRAARLEAGTLFEGLRRLLGPFVYLAAVAGAIGGLALLLAAAGLYAVVAYVVSLRTREFGVRLAVGAAPADIMRLVIAQTARIVCAGAIAGLLITVPLALALRRIFVGISPLDPWAFLPMIGALAAAATIASLLPARRAARIDPVQALRAD